MKKVSPDKKNLQTPVVPRSKKSPIKQIRKPRKLLDVDILKDMYKKNLKSLMLNETNDKMDLTNWTNDPYVCKSNRCSTIKDDGKQCGNSAVRGYKTCNAHCTPVERLKIKQSKQSTQSTDSQVDSTNHLIGINSNELPSTNQSDGQPKKVNIKKINASLNDLTYQEFEKLKGFTSD